MAAVNCPFCNKIMSDSENECPSCHHPLVKCPKCHSINITTEVGEEVDLQKTLGKTMAKSSFLHTLFNGFGLVGTIAASAATSAEEEKVLTVNYKCNSCGEIFSTKPDKKKLSRR